MELVKDRYMKGDSVICVINELQPFNVKEFTGFIAVINMKNSSFLLKGGYGWFSEMLWNVYETRLVIFEKYKSVKMIKPIR